MKIDFSAAKIPPTFVRDSKQCYLDPVRKKLVIVTPEETVRQQVILFLMEKMRVPTDMIQVEVALFKFGLKSKQRVDIVVLRYDKELGQNIPLAVIECKAPGVYLGEKVSNQMVDYANELLCDYCMMTNGDDTLCFHYEEKTDRYLLIEDMPEYVNMIRGEYVESPPWNQPPRFSLAEYSTRFREYDDVFIGRDTPDEIVRPAVNFLDALLYCDHTLPKKQYQLFRLIEDSGLRELSYGNASGGVFSGVYRSFLIEYQGSTEYVSVGFSPYTTDARKDEERTAICVGIDDEDSSHHALQLVLDDNAIVVDNRITFYHHGRIAIGNRGSGKISELRQYVEQRYPRIICGKAFCLGTLTSDRLFHLDDPEIVDFLEKLISYSLIRDDFRKEIKSRG